ncbi:hypothetical protein DL95DRAFT_457524 [Leptodontidium sp. 2 PMI_412]|nr:hypothetical protein DL95DRAFT_457524 [Leptodontidium sp. 2 PMI_412]
MATELPLLSVDSLRHSVLPTPSPAGNSGWDALHRFQLHQAYQRSQLFGFTIRELDDLGCWSQSEAKKSDLPDGKTIPPPFLSQGSWQLGKIPIEHGSLGMWDVNNPIVWNALMPSLLLVSQWILSAHMETWIDGISLNEWQKVPANEVPDGFPKDHPAYQAFFFEPRDGITVAQNIELQRKQIRNLKAYLRYKIDIIPTDGLPVGSLICGLHTADPATHKNRKYDVSTVTIDVQILRPLLRPDITESERLVQQLLVAKTIMHETMHAFGKYTGTGNRVVLDGSEPFFRDEEISELGNSWENGTLGGVLQSLNKSIGNRFSMELALGLASVDFLNYI